MKTFCAILLVGMLAYVQGDFHDCDPFAVNVKTPNAVKREGHDADNKELDLAVFLAKPKVAYYVTHASPTTVPGSNEFCTAPTHGTDCAGVEYARFLIGDYKPDRSEMLKGVEFKTTFIGYDKKDDRAIEYNMTIAGINKDDFIFQWVKDTEITAHLLDPSNDPNKKIKMDINDEILEILKAPFALYSMENGGHALYVTCDGKYAWVAYAQGTTSPPLETLKASINSLVKIAKSHKNADLVVDTIDKEMPEIFHKMITALVEVKA